MFSGMKKLIAKSWSTGTIALSSGDSEAQSHIQQTLGERYEFRCDGIVGPGEGSRLIILNRIVTYDQATGDVSYEADPRRAEMLVRQMNLDKSKTLSTPSEKKRLADVVSASGLPPLDPERASFYRSLVMRAQFLAQDRADVSSESVKSLTRWMQSPTDARMKDLKRLVRYIAGKPRVVTHFRAQSMYKEIKVYCDNEHAGRLLTRKSTSGIVRMARRHCVKHSSNLQSTIALSSGESEYYAAVKAAALGLSLKALLADWGIEISITVLSDSSAARGAASRRGLGKLRHVQTRFLWLQERVACEDLKLEAVNARKNLADLLTKPMTREVCERHMSTLNQVFETGTARGAKALESAKV